MKTIAVIQARTGSTRLPNKVLKKIGNYTLIEILVERLKKSEKLNEIIVAIPENKENNEFANFLSKKKIKFYRGSENNVLDRVYNSIKDLNTDYVIRLTGDNPLTNVELIDTLINKIENESFDYLTCKNISLGLGSELISFKALKETYENANQNFELEHVTPYIYLNPNKFKIAEINFDEELNKSDIRLTIDTKEDFLLLEKLYEKLGDITKLEIKKVFEYLNKNSEFKKINQNIIQKKYNE